MSSEWSKVIVHVDMDAFFAAVEQLIHPEWRGKPVIVGADPQGGKGRGVVSAASYEARRFGVHSAMPISRAYQLCPQAIFVHPHGDIYHDFSQKVFAVLNKFSPLIEPLSIDEAFLDVSGSLHLFGSVEQLGEKIKSEIKSQTGLTASAGIAPSKSVAKIASDYQKPDGLTIVPPDKVQEFLDPLPVTRLWGVGKKTYEILRKMGIQTVAQLRAYPQEILREKFGKMGDHICRMARGEDEREVYVGEDVKSISNEMTFSRDQGDIEVVRKTLFTLAEKVGGRARRAGTRGKTVHLKIRFQGFKTYTRSHTLRDPTNLTQDIYETANLMLCEFDPLEVPVRLVGVGISQLTGREGVQLSLWDLENERKLKLERVMDQIQDRFGKGSIRHAESLPDKKKPRTSME
ncbi:MAG: DNA polymerase IV [Calditrichia bacterium]